MRIAVIGAGGIGGYYGARLTMAGEDVVFLARGAHLQALRDRGLTVRTPSGESTLSVKAVADPVAVGPVDLVLFCVKSYDTQVAAESLRPLTGPQSLVLTLQNGLDNVEKIASVVGLENVLVGSVYVALQLVAPGVIAHSAGEGKIVFGQLAGDPTDRTRSIMAAFRHAGVPCDLSRDMPQILWEKFLFIAGIGGITALTRSGIGAILANAEGRDLLTASCAEVVAVARADGVDLGSDAVARAVRQAEALPPQWRSSMARDLEDGRRLEVEALSGAVLRRARGHRLPTPVHQAIYACLSVHRPKACEAPPGHKPQD